MGANEEGELQVPLKNLKMCILEPQARELHVGAASGTGSGTPWATGLVGSVLT
jgi:hypothetical protein